MIAFAWLIEGKQKQKLEEEFQNEISMFNQFWDEKIEKYDSESAALEKSLQDRQNDELQKYIQSIDDSISKKAKESSEMLNSKAMISHLAKKQEYKEAYLLQQKCKKLVSLFNLDSKANPAIS